MSINGDASTGRDIHFKGSVTFHINDRLEQNLADIRGEVTTAPWLWVQSGRGDFFYIHTQNLKLECVLYERAAHANAAFKLTKCFKRDTSDRTHVIRYGLRLFLGGARFVTGGYENLPKNMNASLAYRQLHERFSFLNDDRIELRDQMALQKQVQKREQEWADEILMLINMQENQEFSLAKVTNFAFHKVEAVHHTNARGVEYAFYVDDFDTQYEMNDLALSDDPFPSSYDGLIMGKVVQYEANKVVLSFPRTVDFGKIQNTGYLIVVPNSTTFRVQRHALQDVVERKAVNTHLLDYVIHDSYADLHIEKLQLEGKGLQLKQIDAIERAVSAQDFLLVQGPPGTGKTTIISEMVVQFVRRGQRVLISSKNNLAVDNVLENLIDAQIDCIRIGREEKVKVPKVLHVLLDRVALQLQENIIRRCDTNQSKLVDAITINNEHLNGIRDAEENIDAYHRHYTNVNNERNSIEKQIKRANRRFVFHRLWGGILKGLTFIGMKKEIHANFQLSWVAKRNERLQSNEIYTTSLQKFNAENQKLQLVQISLQEQLAQQLQKTSTTLEQLSNVDSWISWKKLFTDEQSNLSQQNTIASEWIAELSERQQSLYPLLVQSVQVVGATCIGINTSPEYRDAEFDVVIIDEAGQITIFDALVPMSKAKKVILIGDHMQLPPVADKPFLQLCKEEGLDESLLEKSLFEALFYKAPEANKVMLDTQFRMHPIVAHFISEKFYEGKYKSGKKPHELEINWDVYTSPLVFIDTVDHLQKYEQQDIENDHYVYFNIFEAELCSKTIVRMLREGQKAQDIGIITPYKRQKKEIETTLPNYLRTSGFEYEEVVEITQQLEIDTVDSFQGRGKKIILFSFTRSNPNYDIGFLRELRRLNVTMTRCKSLLVLIGDSGTLTNTRDKRASATFTSMVNYIQRHGQYINIGKEDHVHV